MRALLFLLPASAMAQVICALGSGAPAYQPSADQRPASDAMQLAGRVNDAEKSICGSNCPIVALFRNSTAPNAALIVNAGQPKLVYAPQFFATLYDGYGDPGIVAVIAHELGHALDDTMGAAWINAAWTPELRADSWAGCTLAKAGLGPSDLRQAFSALAKYPSAAHPSWNRRVPALRSGFTHCGGTAATFEAAVRQGK